MNAVQVLRLFVAGTPVPQGSKKGYVVGRRAVIVDDNKEELTAWRAQVSTAAKVLHRDEVDASSAFAVVLEFGMPRPKSVTRELPTVRPDLDKLTRALLDALTGRVWKDDAQVVRLVIDKAYSERPGVEIRVGRITPTRESR